MNTQLGNTTKSFGREYNISTTNLGGNDILANKDLRENSLIVSAKVDNNLEDVGSYSLFMTDSNGQPVRLTYTIEPGHGLYPDPNDNDILRMVIDENSITCDGDELYVNKRNIIDNDTLTVNSIIGDNAKRGRIGVVTDNLQKASNILFGITKCDERTTYIDPENKGIIHVNTKNLETVDDTNNRDGIVRHSSEMFRTIEANNGKLQVITKNLDKASGSNYGIVKTDSHTITANDSGTISVITSGLDKATNKRYGIVTSDDMTTTIKNGQIAVRTQNLEPATGETRGVVMLDTWSIDTNPNNGKIEVKRFNEIEALLNTNNPEHKIFRDDIEDLKNRVSKLETMPLQEVIEFLSPTGDPETSLPMPVFNKETKKVEQYSDRKTIAFTIKSNCKFNINVEYKEGTNDYSQVTLLNVRYMDSITIPANELANNIFDETGNTIQTLYFTFAVKNYDKDDNLASINTQVIVSAASINDSAIKQTSFHIFKCWNNLAFTEDMVENPLIIDTNIPDQSYFLVLPQSKKLEIYGNQYQQKDGIEYNKTESTNFYFNILALSQLMVFENNTWTPRSSEWQKQSCSGDYDVNIDISNNSEFTDSCNWCTASVIGQYNQTKEYNVLNVKSTKTLSDNSRTAYIRLSFKNQGSDTTDINKIKNISVQDTLTLVNITNASSTDSDKFKKVEELKVKLENSSFKATLNTNSALSIQRKGTQYIKSTLPSASDATENMKYSDIINNDITEFNTTYNNLTNNILNGKKTIDSTDEKFVEYKTELDKLDKYADKIVAEYNTFNAELLNERAALSENQVKSIIFIYQENLKSVTASIHVASTIQSSGTNGIKFTVTRNENSILKDPNWQLTVNYSFINKNGDLVNAEGNQNNIEQYKAIMNPGTATTYTTNHTTSAVVKTSSGTNINTTTKVIYYNVVVIGYDINTEAHKSLWGIGEGGKDNAILYFGGWNPNDGTNGVSLSSSPDAIYGIFKCTGQDAGRNGKYFSINLRASANKVQYFCQANDTQFMGISKTPANTNYGGGQTTGDIKIGNTIYIIDSSIKSSTAAANAAKNYYNSNRYKIELDRQTTTVPVQVSSGITGISIRSVDVSNGAFDNNDYRCTYSSSGSWAIIENNDTTSSSKYTFGNAFISNVTIAPWDDYEMEITFTINGGTDTNIPRGSEITETSFSSNGSTKFIFVQDGKSYEHLKYYKYYTFSSTPWNNNSCRVTYKLYNQYSLIANSIYSTSALMYDKETEELRNVYIDKSSEYLDDKDNEARDYVYSLCPYLTYITGLKFWIGLNVPQYTLVKKFESALSAAGSQVQISTRFNVEGTKKVNIINALYNNVATSTSNKQINQTSGGGGGASRTYDQGEYNDQLDSGIKMQNMYNIDYDSEVGY